MHAGGRNMTFIFREAAKLSKAKQIDLKILEIYSWTSNLTAESKFSIQKYYVTKSAKKLALKLTYTKRNLIGLIGLQGTGKTTMLLCLKNLLRNMGKKSVYLKWTDDWFEKEMHKLEFKNEIYAIALNSKLVQVFKDYEEINRRYPRLKRIPTLRDINKALNDEFDIGSAETLLRVAQVKKIKKETVYNKLAYETEFILIDMADYAKSDRRMMNHDLDNIQELWQKLQVETDSDVSFIIAIQKELFKGHFFFGKLDVINIGLLKPKELVEAYKMHWEKSYPFTEDALLRIAEMSRGVFRRFLKYLKLCLEHNLLKAPVTIDHVNEAISLEQQVMDMDLELTDVFSNRERKMEAVKLLNLLRDEGMLNQKEIAEELDVTMMSVSRMVRKLEAYGYVKRKRGSHAQWQVCLV